MSPSRVTFVCQWYAPEPVVQPSWIVDALIDQGLEVDVLTGIPNYPSGAVTPGYRWWRAVREEISGVDVLRAPLYPSHDQSAVKRMANYLSWAVSSTIVGFSRLRRADVALVYSSPATAALPALVAKALAGTPYVLLIQDVWPDSVFSSGFLPGKLGRLAKWLLGFFVATVYRHASHIAVISPGMVDLLVARGVPPAKLSTVYNWVAEDHESSPVARDVRADLGIGIDDLVLMYAGNHGAAQALGTVIDAVASVESQRPVHLLLVGDGMEKPDLVELAAQHETGTIHFLSPVPRSAMPDLMEQADVQIVSLARRPLFAVTTPSKLQSIMAAGQPALVVADGDAAQMVSAAAAGVAAAAEDVAAVREAIQRLAETHRQSLVQMGLNGRKHYEATMSAAIGARRLADILVSASRAAPVAARETLPGVEEDVEISE